MNVPVGVGHHTSSFEIPRPMMEYCSVGSTSAHSDVSFTYISSIKSRVLLENAGSTKLDPRMANAGAVRFMSVYAAVTPSFASARPSSSARRRRDSSMSAWSLALCASASAVRFAHFSSCLSNMRSGSSTSTQWFSTFFFMPSSARFGSQSFACVRFFASSFAMSSSSAKMESSSSSIAAVKPPRSTAMSAVLIPVSSPRSSLAVSRILETEDCTSESLFFLLERARRRSSRFCLRDLPPNHPPASSDFKSTSPSAPHVNESAVTSSAAGAAHPQSSPPPLSRLRLSFLSAAS
mmetsp:Transcript_14114/g.60414  ORF Transcript_14114/g.60414 Transcript_14114/m.60414 type:complete len:293 (-) Transcript_14114:497-1375(-)